jgi:hypothetical protein
MVSLLFRNLGLYREQTCRNRLAVTSTLVTLAKTEAGAAAATTPTCLRLSQHRSCVLTLNRVMVADSCIRHKKWLAELA